MAEFLLRRMALGILMAVASAFGLWQLSKREELPWLKAEGDPRE